MKSSAALQMDSRKTGLDDWCLNLIIFSHYHFIATSFDTFLICFEKLKQRVKNNADFKMGIKKGAISSVLELHLHNAS